MKKIWRYTSHNPAQSVGNMPLPPPLSTFTAKRSPDNAQKNPKYDQLQSKALHNEENSQSMTKMAGNPKFDPFHEIKIAPKKNNKLWP